MRYIKFISMVAAIAFSADVRACGDRYALCVGVSNYTDSTIGNLDYSDHDVTELARLLRNVGYKVVLMTNATGKLDPLLVPTKKNIESQLATLLKSRKTQDSVTLALAGRGLEIDRSRNTYFCPVNAALGSDKDRNLISTDYINSQLERCEAGNKLFLAELYWSKSSRDGPHDLSIARLKAHSKDLFALYGLAASEFHDAHSSIKYGVFYRKLLEGLLAKAGKKDSDIDFTELSDYLNYELPSRSEKPKQGDTMSIISTRGNKPFILLTAADRQCLADVCHDCEVRRNAVETFEDDRGRNFDRWRLAAERGSLRGMILYGLCLETGAGVQKDPRKAFEFYLKAAELGSEEGMFALGQCYRLGVGVERTPAKAVEWYSKAAELDNPEGTYSLGLCYGSGIGVSKDNRKSVELIGKAAELGDSYAMYNFGLCYMRGTGVERNQTKGVEWLTKAAERKCAAAVTSLGKCYFYGDGVSRDEEKALKLFRRAAELGEASAMDSLGYFYHNGVVVEADAAKAIELFRKSAGLGNASAMAHLGQCYLYGSGVAKDATKAVEYFREAAERGNANAMSALGSCYALGEGVEKDLAKSVEWAEKARTSVNQKTDK